MTERLDSLLEQDVEVCLDVAEEAFKADIDGALDLGGLRLGRSRRCFRRRRRGWDLSISRNGLPDTRHASL